MKLSPVKGTVLGGLPVVVSGIVFWGMVLVGLVAIVLISKEQERSFIQQVELNAQVLASVTEELLEHNPNGQPLVHNRNALIALIEREMPVRGFLGVTLRSDNEVLVIGTPPDTASKFKLTLFAHSSDIPSVGSSVELHYFYMNLDDYLIQKRNQLFLTIGGAVFLFGFILQQILQRVLSKPIMDMVDVASKFGAGDSAVRFDETRRDELGYMARFINSALDKMVAEQQATGRALQQLGESQHALQEQHDLLEVRVKERTQALSAANRELEAYSYSIAHDLRQPLRAIDGFSLLLLEDYYDQLDDEGKDYINRVREAAQRMGRLIDDILELSKITRSEIALREVNLSAEAGDILKHLKDAHPERKVKTEVQSGLLAEGDPSLIRVALENLLGNAWKYSAEVPEASIEFGAERIGNCLVYHVSDNGIGFDESYSDKLFRPFERLHNDERFKGTGIGLATVARAVKRMGGDVWATSSPGQGAVFYFTLDRCHSRNSAGSVR
jgi:signal transduction histidine kinase